MTLFRLFLIALLAILGVYTALVVSGHGVNLISPFLSEVLAVTWQGQFNLDFFMYLALSAIWCVWRNAFALVGWILAVFCLFGGMLFFAAYLLTLTVQTGGDMRVVLLGEQRASV